MVILNLFEEQLTALSGQEPSPIRVSMRKVNISNNIILNILSNFIPHEILTCGDKDPPWSNKKIKGIIQEKNKTFKAYHHNSSNIV